jgi:hypothetical protein
MLDALLAAEALPEEYRDRFQVYFIFFFQLQFPSSPHNAQQVQFCTELRWLIACMGIST